MEKIMWMEREMENAERLIMSNEVEHGLRLLNELLYDEPGYAPLHNYLGWAYLYSANDAARAELHLKMAIHFAPEYAPPYVHMGTLCNRAGRFNDAINYFRTGMNKPEALRNVLLEGIAQAFEMLGDYRNAIRAYKEAATVSTVDMDVDRLLKSVSRCRRKRVAMMFSFW